MDGLPAPTRIVPRAKWTRAPHTAERDRPKTGRLLYVHITETPGRQLTTPERERAAIRAIREYHVHGRGWDDIAYSYLVAQPWEREGAATVYVGRGRDRLPASQQGANHGNWGVAVLAVEHEAIMRRTVVALAWLARYLDARGVLGHRDQNATDCPGNTLYGLLPDVRRLAGL